MNFSLLQGVALFASAFVAGMINSIAGGGTLLTFPTLIWLGLDAKEANATSTVALWPGLIGGLYGFRRELERSRPLLVRLGLASLSGGAAGAALLIWTPSQTFARLVPFLIFFATLLFMAQEPITRRLRLETAPDERQRGWWTGAILFQFCAAVYGGYFGAGNGILMLSALGLLGISDIHRANGLKNFLALTLNSAAVIAFAASGLVSWPKALLMASGAMLGGYYGAAIARRLGRTFVRRAVILIGLTIGCLMLWRLSR
ncbi:MAG TPA: sulfite exporter TauE/SafE family protein [Pyrinomonadaceae bacterium]|nr:sulfite exporter TauE/SafE family protein [Pyrinomonadaceae bacterium]